MEINYDWKLTTTYHMTEAIDVWLPVEGDQCSYDVFPCVPYLNMIEKVELRGTELKDGFRIKNGNCSEPLNI